ncbi:MAG: cytidylate kinase-like family protein [Hespellia sp.]|nr:cytidylate kinase-like family protein [Hespellia sp.]
MAKIITIARECGAAGSTIGRAVADRLGFEYYDKALILKAAKEAGTNVEEVLDWDEKVPVDFGFAQSLFNIKSRPQSERLYEIQKDVIRSMGDQGDCVIVGRNANVVLKEYEHCLKVFLYADESWRVEWMRQSHSEMSEEEVRAEIKSVDKNRKKYCSYFTETQMQEAVNYDLCLKVSAIGIEQCVDTICRVISEMS